MLVLDRNFEDYRLLAYAIQHGREGVFRGRHGGFSALQYFWDSPQTECLITLSVPVNVRRWVREQDLPQRVPVRLLKFRLPSGETEVLVTTLTDAQRFPADDLFQVYGCRWEHETYYNRVKNIFEVERFSGTSPEVIRQDFFGVLFLATLEAVLARGPQAELTARDEVRETRTQSQVNRAGSYVALIDRVASLLADDRISLPEVLRQLQRLFLTNPTRHLAGRASPRPPPKVSRKLRFQQYVKRIIA